MTFSAPFRWIADRLKDLLYDPTNLHLDPGRVAAWLSIALIVTAAIHNAHIHQPIDLGPTGLPGGLAGLLGALVIYLYHDRRVNGQ